MLSNVRAAVPLLEPSSEKRDKEKPKEGGGGGRRSFAFWSLVAVLLALAAGNLALTATMVSVLRLGLGRGAESLELPASGDGARFTGAVRLEHAYARSGEVRGFRDEPVRVEAEAGGRVAVSLDPPQSRAGAGAPSMTASARGLSFDRVQSFTVGSAFTVPSPSYKVNAPMRSLHAAKILAGRVASPLGLELSVRAESHLNALATEGVRAESERAAWTADRELRLRANGSIALAAKEGVYLSAPVADGGGAEGHFKLCVCMPQGKLFRLPVPTGQARVSCSHVNLAPEHNPCL